MDQPSFFDRAPLGKLPPFQGRTAERVPTSTPYQIGSDTSKDAAKKAQDFVCEQGWKVYGWLQKQGERGGTQKEAAGKLGLGRPSLCARFRALEQGKWIVKTEHRRAGCAVYVSKTCAESSARDKDGRPKQRTT